MPAVRVPLYLLVCYWIKLLNPSHWITTFFSSTCVMKTDEGLFSSFEAKTRLTCYGHSLCGRFNNSGQMSHSLLLNSSLLIALVPISAGLLIPLTCLRCETSVYPISQPLDWPQTLVVYDGICVSTAVLLLSPTKNCNIVSSFRFPWLSASSIVQPWLPLAIQVVVLKDASSVLLCVFQSQMFCRLSNPLGS